VTASPRDGRGTADEGPRAQQVRKGRPPQPAQLGYSTRTPDGMGNRTGPCRAQPPGISSAVVPKVTLWFLMGDTMATQYDRVSPESRAGRLNVSQTVAPREHFSGG